MRKAVVGILILAGAALGLAADAPIGAVKLVVTRSSSGAEKLVFVSKDVHFLFPAIGGADDPSIEGASVTLVSPIEAPVTLAYAAAPRSPRSTYGSSPPCR